MSDPASFHRVNSVECDLCGEAVPRDHTVMRAEYGRLCWFCNGEVDESADEDWDDEYDDDWDL